MNTDQSRIKSLFQKHLQGTASPEEIRELFGQIGQEKSDEEILSSLDLELMETDPLNLYDKKRWDAVFALVKDDVSAIEEDVPVKRKKFGYAKVGIAAAVALIVLGIYFFNSSRHPELVSKPQTVQNDIAPGRQSATLTLADGKKIVLSDAANGKLLEEAGVSITKAADGQLVYELKDKGQSDPNKINTLSTAKGETYRLRLPDGSLVWLNAASSLTYAFSLNERGERRVKLSGEAYFEIAKDKAHPFVVSTDRQEVQVLGTHFNISAYRDESSIRTTLLEGRVRVSSLESLRNGTAKILEPNLQAVNTGNAIQVVKVNAEYAVAWKNGYFMFNDEPLENILLEVSRWYNVQIRYDLPEIRKMRFYGTVSRFENVSKVLEKLELTDKVKFEIKDKQIKVFRKNP